MFGVEVFKPENHFNKERIVPRYTYTSFLVFGLLMSLIAAILDILGTFVTPSLLPEITASHNSTELSMTNFLEEAIIPYLLKALRTSFIVAVN